MTCRTAGLRHRPVGPPGPSRGTPIDASPYLEGVTIDTGRGHPGAKALEYHSNNVGRLENVVLRSSDAAGVLELDLTHRDVGPALVKRGRVDGFDVGVASRQSQQRPDDRRIVGTPEDLEVDALQARTGGEYQQPSAPGWTRPLPADRPSSLRHCPPRMATGSIPRWTSSTVGPTSGGRP